VSGFCMHNEQPSGFYKDVIPKLDEYLKKRSIKVQCLIISTVRWRRKDGKSTYETTKVKR